VDAVMLKPGDRVVVTAHPLHGFDGMPSGLHLGAVHTVRKVDRGIELDHIVGKLFQPEWFTRVPPLYAPGPRQARAQYPLVTPAAPLQAQIGGSHYKDMAIQPIEYVMANAIPFAEGNIIKYVSRWRKKGGIQDLKKARHMLDVLIEHEEKKEKTHG
jgi:hypothetical protein